ncbi:MAG: copper resistance protein CopC [Caldilineaceae bacterium]
MKRKLALPLFAGLLLTLLLLVPVQRLYAHAEYDHSEPAADAVMDTAPTQVRIWFTQELFRHKGANSIEVEGPDGSRVDQNDFAIDDDDRTLASVSLSPTLSAGVYTVHWVATSSEDGHEAKGEFTFTIGNTSSGGTQAESQTLSTTVESATATSIPEPMPTATDTVQATVTSAPTPATQPTSTGSGSTLPCLGGTMPLAMVLGAVIAGRKRMRKG